MSNSAIPQPTVRNITVLKIGGSLYDLPDLKSRLERLIASYSGRILLVPGGGRFADEIRRLETVHQWTPEVSHHLALRSMSMGAHLLSSMLQKPVLTSWDEINPGERGTSVPCFSSKPKVRISDSPVSKPTQGSETAIVDVIHLPGLEDLPASWDVTSDSIAAWLAVRCEADRLILVKSVDALPSESDWNSFAESGLVDVYFPMIALKVSRVTWVNLRTQ